MEAVGGGGADSAQREGGAGGKEGSKSVEGGVTGGATGGPTEAVSSPAVAAAPASWQRQTLSDDTPLSPKRRSTLPPSHSLSDASRLLSEADGGRFGKRGLRGPSLDIFDFSERRCELRCGVRAEIGRW